MESTEHLARVLSLQSRGVHVLLWEDKSDLVRALLVLRASFSRFPESLVLLPTADADLQKFSIQLFEDEGLEHLTAPRVFLVPQATTESLGAWLNGWRRRLADPPGTLLVVRRADFTLLFRRAPDLMSFAQSEVHEATGLLPLIRRDILERMPRQLEDAWTEPLNRLPGELPSDEEIAEWIDKLESHTEG